MCRAPAGRVCSLLLLTAGAPAAAGDDAAGAGSVSHGASPRAHQPAAASRSVSVRTGDASVRAATTRRGGKTPAIRSPPPLPSSACRDQPVLPTISGFRNMHSTCSSFRTRSPFPSGEQGCRMTKVFHDQSDTAERSVRIARTSAIHLVCPTSVHTGRLPADGRDFRE
jgi:hypothetical protein